MLELGGTFWFTGGPDFAPPADDHPPWPPRAYPPGGRPMIRSRFAPVCIGLLLAGPVPSGRARAEDWVDFARNIRLTLAGNCYERHGPEKQQSRPRLDRKADAAERP